MPVKKGKKSEDKAMDFSTFMSGLQKEGLFQDYSDKKDVFYKFGDYGLDRYLGGGLPAGQIFAFQGPQASGKSLAALILAKSVVAQGKRVMYFDTENKIASRALEKLELNNQGDMFTLLRSAGNLEDCLDTLMQALESDLFGLIVIDSVDALTTDEQDERDIHDGSKVGGYKAKVLSEWMGKVSTLSATHDCSVLLTRQVRDNPGAMYGSPETTSGGKAIGHYATTILRFGPDKKANAEENGTLAYQGATVTIQKMNQGARPMDPVHIRFYIGDRREWGLDIIQGTFDEAKRLGVWAPPTATSHKYIPCDALCAELNCTPEELTRNGANNVLDLLMNDEIVLNAVRKIIDDCDGQPITVEEEGVEFEEIDE